MSGIVIVGAGQAGASLAAKLRALGYEATITMIGDEPVPPYRRPPLSKGYLLGETRPDQLYLRADAFWKEQNITLRLGAPVTSIDRAAKCIRLGSEIIPYGQLVLTTGSRPRRLPAAIGGELEGVYTVRTIADVNAMAPEFKKGRRLLIVGGGYVGLEAAAVGAKLGLDVTLIEMAPRILQRVAAAETSGYFRKLHVDHGVRLLENTGLEGLTGKGRVSRAILSDGAEIAVDFVIVGVGVFPVTQLAEEAGLDIENGIRIDEFGRTADPCIWAAGDCTSFPFKGGRIRLESVGNAIDQAGLVAENLLGINNQYRARPWFWSDQYDVKLQIAGLNSGYNRVVTRGESEVVSFWYYADDELLAVDAMNDPRAYMVGKRLIELGMPLDSAVIADPNIDIRTLLNPARSCP